MKKKIILAIAGIACLASCGGGGEEPARDLTPVEDHTGLERAEKIWAVQSELIDAIEGSEVDDFFSLMPKKFTINKKIISTYKDRTLSDYYVEEIDVKNLTELDIKIVVDLDKLYYHKTITENYLMGFTTMPSYVDEYFYLKDEKYYHLFDDGTTKVKEPVEEGVTPDEAKGYIFNALTSTEPGNYYAVPNFLVGSVQTSDAELMPYLSIITQTDSDEEEEYYILPKQYKIIKDKLASFNDKEQYFNYQFGSDDEKSLSLRNNISFDASSASGFVRYNGYGQGAASFTSKYAKNYGFEFNFTSPDIIIFKNNFLTYAQSIDTIDITSEAGSGIEAGALYKKDKITDTTEIDYSAVEVSYPNPDDYIPLSY